MGEAALTPLRPPTKEQLHPPDAGPPTPVCGETTRLQSPWAHDGRTSEEPCDLTCAWWPSGQTLSPCPSTSSEEGGRGPGPARGGSPAPAWPCLAAPPARSCGSLVRRPQGRAPLPMVPARCTCSLCGGGRPGWPWAFLALRGGYEHGSLAPPQASLWLCLLFVEAPRPGPRAAVLDGALASRAWPVASKEGTFLPAKSWSAEPHLIKHTRETRLGDAIPSA